MSSAIFTSDPVSVRRREAVLLRLAFLFLLLTSAALLLSRAVRFSQPQALLSRLPVLAVPVLWAVGATIIHRVLNRVRPARDPLLLPTAMLLTGWGLLVIWRISPEFGARQTAWFLVGVAGVVGVVRGPADLRWLRRYRYVWLTGGILLASLTLVLGTHPSGGEPRLWLGCCGFYLQPSEPLRLLLIAYLASYLAHHAVPGPLPGRRPWLPTLAPLLVMWGLSTALLLVQRDLGTGTLFVALLALMLYVATGRWQILMLALGLAVFGGAFGYTAIGIVRQRLDSWINPWADPIGASYQIVQSLIGVASGGIVGRGLGLGSPTLIPVVHTDLIYAAVAEEWGLLGAAAMIALLAIFVSRGLRVAASSRDPFAVMLAAGLSLAIGLQAVLIIGGVIRLLPLTGVTLPFVSYGGSSLVTSYLSLAFLLLLSGEKRKPGSFNKPLAQTGAAFLVVWVGLALGTGWWTLYRAPVLTARTDNARRALAELTSPRGRIVDREGRSLAETTGGRGSYQRSYPEPAAYSLVGYDSARYAQAGVEAAMDAVLRGESGHDAWSIWWSHLLTGTPPPGLDVRLTIDLDLQAQAASLLGSRPGALIVVEPSSGDILALVSSPTYDPNRLDEDWAQLIARSDAPLLNRATQATVQPGTALAPFVLAWAERQGEVAVSDVVTEPGRPLAVNGRTLGCLESPEAERATTYGLGLRLGCPSPLADLGVELGAAAMEGMASAFGFDRVPVIGIEVAQAQAVSMPREAEALRLAAAGQGTMTVTALQLVRAFSALATGGDLPSLRLLDAVRTPNGDWMPVATQEPPSAVLPRDVAMDLVQALRLPNSRLIGYSAQAIVGPGSERLAWFLGATIEGAPDRAVVVVLERAAPADARQIGLRLLTQAFP
ncbi:MAG: FtsW/RodA/SpoVE family cell cycle protein [Chloroflexota bacterium]